ncbi:hypothetical protein P9112_001261 [Eukaryota sp. TZLM1-RC]
MQASANPMHSNVSIPAEFYNSLKSNRKILYVAIAALGIVVLAVLAYFIFRGDHCDLFVQNGLVYDGSLSTPPQLLDLCIKDGKIRQIVNPLLHHQNLRIGEVIDATGQIVTPGFIDAHAHWSANLEDKDERNQLHALHDGITTKCYGRDGFAPDLLVDDESLTYQKSLIKYLDELDKAKIGVNIAMWTGHGSLRQRALQDDESKEDLTDAEIAKMKDLLEEDLKDDRIFGLSLGLEYYPATSSSIEELKELSPIVGQYNKLLTAHVRGEYAWEIEESSNELIDVAAHGKCKFSHTHIKIAAAVGGAELAHDLLDRIFDAPRSFDIPSAHADVYPWIASATTIRYFFDSQYESDNISYTGAEGEEEFYTFEECKLDTTGCYVQMRDDLEANVVLKDQGQTVFDASMIFFVSDPLGRGTMQQYLSDMPDVYEANDRWADIPWAQHKDWLDVMIDIGPITAQLNALFEMKDEIQDVFIKDTRVGICSDGGLVLGHPRSSGSFARVIEHHVYERNVIDLQTAIYKMTGLNAEIHSIPNRGYIRENYYADLLIFRPELVRQKAGFNTPFKYSVGFDTVIVNGKFALKNGEHQGNHGQLCRVA